MTGIAGLPARPLRPLRRPDLLHPGSLWSVAVSIVAVAGLALAPAFSLTSGPHGATAAGPTDVPASVGVAAGAPAGGGTTGRAIPSIGQVTVSSTGVSSAPSVVVVNVTAATATVLESFYGNLSDFWPDSTLLGSGFTINATPYLSDSNAVGVAANGITVKDIATVSTGSTDGILVSTAVTLATVESSTVSLATESTNAVGIQAGEVFPALQSDEPTGTFLLTGNTVNGPGSGGTPGEEGILVYGATVLILNNTVRGFSSETATSGYSSWIQDILSVGIYAGCSELSTTCTIEGNSVEGSSVGIAYQLVTSGTPPAYIIAGPATIEVNKVSESLAYGLVVNATDAAGTTIVEQNLVNNPVSGAPGMFLLGTTFEVTNNIFVGTSASGSNGGSQGEGTCPVTPIATASVQASDCFSPTQVTLNANLFAGTSAAYWATESSPVGTSYLDGGELVTFSETNLPSGTPWSVTIAGTNGTEMAGTPIVGELQNGSWMYATMVSDAGYYQMSLPPSGTLVVNQAPVTEALVYTPLETGQVVLTTTCASTNLTLVSVEGTTFTVLQGFHGNITDLCPDSTLEGHGLAINASGLSSDANAVGVAADGITVNDVSTVTTGYVVGGFPQTGIAVAPAITTATIEGSTATATASRGAPAWGIWAGNFASDPATQTVGTFTITGNTVRGPGGTAGSALAGSIGIVAGGVALTISDNTVSGFSAVMGTGGHTGYNWWDGTQSLGVLAACAPGASTCLVEQNTVTDNAIGVTSILFSSTHGVGYQTGAITILGNDINDSGGYGIYADMSASSGNGGQPATGTTSITDNTIDNTLTGAPAMSLTGATFQVVGNVLIGTSTSGDQGASQDQGVNFPAIPTASIEATDFGNAWTGPDGPGVTQVTLETNFFLDTNVYWSASFDFGSTSTQTGGELVTLSETGLVPGTAWSVTLTQVLNSVTYSGMASVGAPSEFVADAQNGSCSPPPVGNCLSYDVAHVTGYTTSGQITGLLIVNGEASSVATVFTQVLYSVTFTESGLPSGTSWSVKLAGVQKSSAVSSIVFTEPNGSFAYTAGTTVGYVATPGTVTVTGAAVTLAVSFSPAIYAVTYTETGLPRGTEWWVNLSSEQSFHSTTTMISFLEANGSFAYHFGAENRTKKEFAAPGGTLVVNAATVAKSVGFTTLYPVTFQEGVLPYGTEWWVNVTVGPAANTSTNGTSLVFWEGNGVYSFVVAPADKRYAPVSGTFVVHNGGVSRKVNFALVMFPVTFQESGLPPGVKWCVALSGGKKHCATGTSLTFDEPNGTYVYMLTSGRAGYFAPGGSFSVAGAGVVGSAPFSSTTYDVTFTQTGLPSATKWWVNITGEPSLSSTGTTITVPLPNGNYTYSVGSSVKTYSALGGSFKVSGGTVALTVSFTSGGGGAPAGGVPFGAIGGRKTPLLAAGATAEGSVGLWAAAAAIGLLGLATAVGRRGWTRGGKDAP